MTVWAGVDVGGRRKGFHIALIDEAGLVSLGRAPSVAGAVAEVRGAHLVAVDASRSTARPGETTRDCERLLARAVCGIRWTPDEKTIRNGNPYYEWIEHGLELYEALEEADVPAIECFPTASWTRWGGKRDGRSRARWSNEILGTLALAGCPRRSDQDERDAIAAALTARAHTSGLTDQLGEIVVPREGAATRGRRSAPGMRARGAAARGAP